MKSTIAQTNEEEMLKILSEQAPVGVCIMQDGKFCYVNANFPLAIGYTVDELLGKDSSEIVFPEDSDMVRENTIKMLKGELTLPYQFRVIHKNGSIVWVMATVKSIEYHGRRATLGNYMEITGRKQLEETLKEREERYRELANSITDVFFAMDDRLRYTYWNKASEILTGIPAEDALGKCLPEIFPDTPGIKRAEKTYRSVLRTQQPQTFVNDYIDRDGRHYIFEISAYPSRAGISVFVRDITERKRAEESLQQSEEKYRALFDSSGIGMFAMDAETMRIVICNQAAARMFGFSSTEEAIGVNPLDFILPEDKDKAFEITTKEMFEQDLRRTHEYRVVNKDGREGWASVTGARIMHEGRSAGLVSLTDITERKQAVEALRQSEERYRTMLEEMEDAYFEVDLGGHLTFVNNSVCRDLGYSKEELMGMSESVFGVFNEVYRTNMPNKGFSWKTTRKDGSHGFAETSVSPMRNNKGEIIGFSGVGRDVTERKQTEAALRQSEENYRALFDSAVIGAFVIDAETMKVVIANQAALEVFGFSSLEEVIGVDPLDFVHPDDRERVFKIITKDMFEQDLRQTNELRAITKDGKEIWISATGSRITHAGRLAGLISFTEITERKQAEEALKQSEQNYRALFDSAVIGTIVLDAKTMKVVIANQAAAKIFGFSSVEEVLEVDPLDFIRPEDKARISELAEKALFEQDSQLIYELGVVTKDGRKIWISATGARIIHEGRLAGLISFTDITEKRQQNERLIMADRLASIGELAAGTAHELNNPLTSVIGFAELLMEKDTPDYIRRDLAFIKSEAQRAITVTSNLLTFARKYAPEKRLNQINEIIEDILQLRAYAHKSNGIDIERHLAPNLPEIMVDYFQMQQVFLNIIINAEYFMTEAHKMGTLTITTKKQNNTVRISLADDGPGIPPENLSHIFDPFFTTKEPGKGTGLGLSICHGIVAEHGGQIYAKSQPGKGATILVELPINGSDHTRSVP